jgi:hypothetical protein
MSAGSTASHIASMRITAAARASRPRPVAAPAGHAAVVRESVLELSKSEP